MRTSLLSALLVIFTLGFAQGILAEEVTFNFSGHVTTADGESLSGTGITVGSSISGTIVYQSDAPEIGPPDPNIAIYQGTSSSINIEGYIVEADSPEIVIANDYGEGPVYVDVFECEVGSEDDISTDLPENVKDLYILLINEFDNSTGPPFTSKQLPLTLNVDDFLTYDQQPGQYMHITGVSGMYIEFVMESIERYYPDTDSDGVPDHLDICPNTPPGKPMKANGCVEGDYDNDGDIDGNDLGSFSEQFGLQPML